MKVKVIVGVVLLVIFIGFVLPQINKEELTEEIDSPIHEEPKTVEAHEQSITEEKTVEENKDHEKRGYWKERWKSWRNEKYGLSNDVVSNVGSTDLINTDPYRSN